MARLLSNTDSGNARAWLIYGEKPSVVPQGMPAMSEGGNAVRDVPVRQVSVAEVDE